jgi:hypothetical protein
LTLSIAVRLVCAAAALFRALGLRGETQNDVEFRRDFADA